MNVTKRRVRTKLRTGTEGTKPRSIHDVARKAASQTSSFVRPLRRRAPSRSAARRVPMPPVAPAHAEVVDGPDVQPAQLKHQVHLGRPPADAAHGAEAGDDLVVGELRRPVEDDGAIFDLSGQVPSDASLAADRPAPRSAPSGAAPSASGVRSPWTTTRTPRWWMARAAGPASCWKTIARTSVPKCPSGSRGRCVTGPTSATRSASTGSRSATSLMAAANEARVTGVR
jgi:hypothetical protein